MPRRRDVPDDVMEVLELLHLRLRSCPAHPAEAKIAWYSEAKKQVGPKGAKLAMMLYEANIPLTQVNQSFTGVNTVPQNNAPGGQSVSQTAGGNMTGVNATGTQMIRDITVYTQDLNQTGAAIAAPVREALVAARKEIESASVDPGLKPILVEQFDKLTEELKKGDKRNAGLLGGLWTMVHSAVKAVPDAVSAVASLEKLKDLIGI